MMSIGCPYCGPRNQDEFVHGGQAHIQRPQEPEAVSDETWARYQFVRDNPCGLHLERWQHLYGCGQWFHLARDTLSDEITMVYRIDQDPPEELT